MRWRLRSDRPRLSCRTVARVIVIGAGISGLSTAVRLADFGHDVTVFEQNDAVGGRVATYTRDGVTFEAGPALLTLPAVYRDLFRKTGRPLEQVLDIVPAEPAVGYRFADGSSLDLPNASRARTTQALDRAFGPGSGQAWQAVIEHGRRVWQLLRSPYLTAIPSRRELARLSSPSALRTLTPTRSLRDLGVGLLDDPRLQAMLERPAAGTDPRRAPAALAAIPYLHETFGRWHLRGGMTRLVDALRTRAIERGAALRTGTRVIEVLTTAGQVRGVRLHGGEPVGADVVIAAVDARHLYGDLLPVPAGPSEQRRLPRVAPSPSVFTLLLAVGAPAPRLPHHTALVAANRDAELDAVFGPAPSAPVAPTIDISTSGEDAGDAGSAQAWTAQVVVPRHGPVDWAAPGLADSYADHVVATMAERGLDIRSSLRARVVLTPAHLLQTTGAPGAWGNALDGLRSIWRRPGNRTPVRGLFLVGSSTHPGPGLPLVGLSSAVVADLVGRA